MSSSAFASRLGFAMIIGLDIGGANLKFASAAGQAVSIPFPLWQKPDQLASGLRTGMGQFGQAPTRLAITMTGELCDCFANKRAGVQAIVAAVESTFPNCDIRYWQTNGRFVSANEAIGDHMATAAANWHALATFVGRYASNNIALMFDIGSTTTDLIPIIHGKPSPQGKTDPERLCSGELVYTGTLRTPVCALMGNSVMAEFFATVEDAYIVLGKIPEGEHCQTADGKPATRPHALARLARMLGGDCECCTEEQLHEFAKQIQQKQMEWIDHALTKIGQRGHESFGQWLISGSGEFFARDYWQSLPDPKPQLWSFAEQFGSELSSAACAYALSQLATENVGNFHDR